jgi:hypothetical protein
MCRIGGRWWNTCFGFACVSITQNRWPNYCLLLYIFAPQVKTDILVQTLLWKTIANGPKEMQYMYLEEFCKKWNGRIVVLIFSIALWEGSPYTLHICNASETHTRRHYNWQTKSNNNLCSAFQAYLTMTFTAIVVQQSFHSRLRNEHEQLTRKTIFSQQTTARASSVPLKSIPSTCYNVPVQYIRRELGLGAHLASVPATPGLQAATILNHTCFPIRVPQLPPQIEAAAATYSPIPPSQRETRTKNQSNCATQYPLTERSGLLQYD